MDNALKLLGLIYRAKRMLLGEEVLDNMRDIKLILLASDISEKSKERYLKKCTYYKIDYLDCFTSEQLSSAIGKKIVKVIGITDSGFKKTLLDKI